jgi:hypothetical protein
MQRPPNPDDPQAPERLIRALKGLQPERVFVPPALDTAILRRARQQLEPEPLQHCSPWWRAWVPWVAASASICLVVVVGWLATSRPPSGVASIPEDVNGDGHVDILDAFQLARELGSGQPPISRDFDQDGLVDQADVEFVARRAVKLDEGGAL